MAQKILEKFCLENIAKIPEEMRALNRWGCWRVVVREGKATKLPVNAKTGQAASSTNASDWCDFDTAIAAFRSQGYQGIGFAFFPEDGLCGIDIDNCVNPETGKLEGVAPSLLRQMNTYSEFSPSKLGIKMFLRAKLPGKGKRKFSIEFYSQGRFFTVTGLHFSESPLTVESRQTQLDEIYETLFGGDAPEKEKRNEINEENDPALRLVRQMTDDSLIQRATSASNGKKFLELWEGDLTNHNGDHSRADASLCSILAYWTRRDAARVDRMFRRSRLMREKWDEMRGRQTYGEITVENACGSCVAVFDPEFSIDIREHSESALGDMLVELYGSDFAWARHLKSWMHWKGVHWEEPADEAMYTAARGVSRELHRRALLIEDETIRKSEKKWAVKAADRRPLEAMVWSAKQRLVVPPEQLDQDTMIFACSNGIIDLQTGELRSGRREDWITRHSEAKFNEKAKCPTFEKFLMEVLRDDSEMVEYFWRVIGYSLTGSVRSRAFFILHGSGRNGKTTVVETLMRLLGSYSQKARFATFLQKQFAGGGANDDIAHLAGARFVAASEASERAALNVPLVKEMTGDDMIRARHLYGKEFQFRPQLKLMLVTNYIPPIRDTGPAIWDRIHFIPFLYRVPEEKIDLFLPLRFLAEMDGILARAVRGCLEWQKIGLRPPACVLKAGQTQRSEMDLMEQFITQKCDSTDTTAEVNQTDLYKAFSSWCKEDGISHPPSARFMVRELLNKGFTFRVGAGRAKFITGLKLDTLF